MTSEIEGSFLTPGGSFAAPEPAHLSSLLDGYEVSELIACGGMGAVYRALQVELEREVAIKVLPRELSRFEEFKKGFRTEARAMAKLNHSNLVGVHDCGEVEGMLYLVMEFVDGASLFEAGTGEAVEALQAVRIVAGVAEGLGQAHKAGILHRDIKPANILISQDLEPKLGDFGLAVSTADVGSGLKMGTPGYMAPEVVRDFRSATPASDVYSLGVILYELVTGVTPTDKTPPKLEIVPRLRGLVLLVQKSTAREPYMRYADGEEMAKALHRWLAEAEKVPLHVVTAAESAATPRPLVHPRPAPLESARRAGSPAMVIAIVGIVAMLLVGLLAFGKGGCGNQKGGGGSVPRPKPDFDIDGHKSEICEKLMAALNRHIEAKRANFARLKSRAGPGEGWAAYFALADEKRGRLPRFLGDYEIVLDETMAKDLNEFASRAQADLERRHARDVRAIHKESVKTMKAEARDQLPADAAAGLGSWVVWLKADLLEILDFDPVGVWKSWPGQAQDPNTMILIGPRSATVATSEGDREDPGTMARTRDGSGLTVVRGSDSRTWGLTPNGSDLAYLDVIESGRMLARFSRQHPPFRPNKLGPEPDPPPPPPDPEPDPPPPPPDPPPDPGVEPHPGNEAGDPPHPAEDVAKKNSPEDAHAWGGHHYKLFVLKEHISFDKAKDECAWKRGHLAYFETAEEHEFIVGIKPAGTFWIGGTDRNDEGRFTWLDGGSLPQGLNFLRRQNKNDRDFLHLTDNGAIGVRQKTGHLDKAQFEWVIGYVCEWDE